MDLGSRIRRMARSLWFQFVVADLMLARAVGDNKAVVDDMLEVGRLRGENGRLDVAEVYFQGAKHRAKAMGYPYAEAHAGAQVGAVLIAKGSFNAARLALESAVPVLRQHGDRRVLPDSLLKLGVANYKLGNFEAAMASWNEALIRSRANKDRYRESLALMDLGRLAYDERRYVNADSYWHEALSLFRQARDWEHVAWVAFFLGLVSRHFGRLDEASELMEESRLLYKRIGDREHLARADEYLTFLQERGPSHEWHGDTDQRNSD